MDQRHSPDITRDTIHVLIIGVLLAASLWTMLPFIGPLVWAAAIVVSTWPMLRWVQARLGGRRSLATAVLTLLMVLIFIVPFGAAIAALLDASTEGADALRAFFKNGLGPPPAWVAGVPFGGDRLAARWNGLAA